MKNILLTGGLGYIASHTAVELLKDDYNLILVDDLYNSKLVVLDRLEAITGVRPTFYQVDCCDKVGMEQVFQENKIDGVIHFAGYKAVGESVEKPISYYRNNLDSTLTLLELMEAYDVNHLVFSSSATVYGNPETLPLKEGMPTSCTNPYGWTKYMIEQILQDAAVANPKLSIALLRYFNPIGAHESGLIGEDPNGIPNNLVPYIAQVAIGKREQVQVFGNDYDTVDGTGVRDYIHVVDLAMGHVKALGYIFDHVGADIFNLGTGVGYSVLQVIDAFSKACGKELPYKITPRRAGDIASCYADAQNAKDQLGWTAQKGIKEMCADSWRWQQQNPNGYND